MKREQIKEFCETVNELTKKRIYFTVFLNDVCIICHEHVEAKLDTIMLTIYHEQGIKCSIIDINIKELTIFLNYNTEFYKTWK